MEQDLHPFNYEEDTLLKSYLKQFFSEEYKANKKDKKGSSKRPECVIL